MSSQFFLVSPDIMVESLDEGNHESRPFADIKAAAGLPIVPMKLRSRRFTCKRFLGRDRKPKSLNVTFLVLQCARRRQDSQPSACEHHGQR